MNSRGSMRHNAVIENAMEVQAVSHYRIAADKPEAQVLCEMAELAEGVPGRLGVRLRKWVKWLLDHDQRENADHLLALQAAKSICGLLETSERSPLPRTSAQRI